jgi:hypothetical protein
MTIETKDSFLHWNYFLALESDLQQAARYIEFSEANFETYSIELAHLLLASASEVDVVAKGICALLEPDSHAGGITQYRRIITRSIPGFQAEEVTVPRFGLTLHPWSNWSEDRNPLWWRSYNQVKHHRNDHFRDATLKNALNSAAALLVAVFYFYKLKFASEGEAKDPRDVTQKLTPESQLLRLQDCYYYGYLLIE